MLIFILLIMAMIRAIKKSLYTKPGTNHRFLLLVLPEPCDSTECLLVPDSFPLICD